MKIKNKILFIISILLLLTGCKMIESSDKSSHTEQASVDEYQEIVEQFETINVDELHTKIKNNDYFVLFVGRESCPYCRMFIPKLHTAVEDDNSEIYYLNTENARPDNEIGTMMEALQVKYVPSLISFNGNAPKDLLDIDSENISVEEINEFLR